MAGRVNRVRTVLLWCCRCQVTSADLEFFADVWASMPRKGVLRRDSKHLNMNHLKLLLFRLGIPLGFDPLLYVCHMHVVAVGQAGDAARVLTSPTAHGTSVRLSLSPVQRSCATRQVCCHGHVSLR